MGWTSRAEIEYPEELINLLTALLQGHKIKHTPTIERIIKPTELAIRSGCVEEMNELTLSCARAVPTARYPIT